MKRTSQTSALLLLAMVVTIFLGAPPGCSFSTEIRLEAEIEEGIEIPEGGSLMVQVFYDIEPEPVEDRNGDGVPDEIEPDSSRTELSIGLVPDQRVYSYETVSLNQSPVWAVVFIDLNENALLDEGEPFAGEPGPGDSGCGLVENETWNLYLLVGGAFEPEDEVP